MIFSSLIFTLIAFLFLRIQIRANIQRLANSAKEFGDGKKIINLNLRGSGNSGSRSSFIQMKKKINNYIEQRTSFLSGISHDLGTILTRIKL